MHRTKHMKLGLIIIAFLDLILLITIKSLSPICFLVLPLAYILFIIWRIKRYQAKLTHMDLDQVDDLSGLDFEYFLFYLFKKRRIHTKITSYSHDFGADLILRYHGKRIVIQAKRWSDNVGIQAVQETIGAMSYYKAKHGVVITNSFYTKSAIELANASDIVLLNRYDLASMITMDANEIMELLWNRKQKKSIFFEPPSNLCPYCKGQLVKRNGRYGSFYGCSNYPRCTYTKDSK